MRLNLVFGVHLLGPAMADCWESDPLGLVGLSV